MKNLSIAFLLSCGALFGEIHEVELIVDNIDCQWCPIALRKALQQVPGVGEVTVNAIENIASCSWKPTAPFQAIYFYRQLSPTQFIIKQMTVDVSGTISDERSSMTLTSYPDGTVFYVENREDAMVQQLKDKAQVHCHGTVSSQQGFNFLMITDVVN